MLGRKHLGAAGLYPADAGSPAAMAQQKQQATMWLSLGAAVIVLAGLAIYTGVLPVTADAAVGCRRRFLLLLTVVFFGWLFLSSGWTPRERKQIYVIGVLFLAAALFWSEFEQAGSTLNLFADRDTNNVAFGCDFPEQLVPVAQRAVHHHAGAAVRLAVDSPRPSGHRAVEPGEVRRRARSSSAPASRCSLAAPCSPNRASRSARCGWSSPTCCTPAASCP